MSDKTLVDLYNTALKAYKETNDGKFKKMLSELIDLLGIEIDSRLEITMQEETMTNKTEEVLKYLQNHKSITSWTAISDFGATRLSDIIYRLKKRGYNIITKREEIVDRYGNTCQFARYVYLGKDKTEYSCWWEGHPFFKSVFKKGK